MALLIILWFLITKSVHILCREQKCCSVLQNYICHLFNTIAPRWPNTVHRRRVAVARTKQNNEFSSITFCYLLNCYYSFSLSFALFLHLNMCPCGSSNCINIASSTTNHSAYCIQWNRHLFGPKWGI